MKKIIILINTYNRPDKLLNLLKQVNTCNYHVHIAIIEDYSLANYERCRYFLSKHFNNNHSWLRSEEHCGKANYWQLINTAYKFIKNKEFDYIIHLPDDISLIPNFIFHSVQLFDNIRDPFKACLNLLKEIDRKNTGWTNQPEEEGRYTNKTQWVDMCYIADSRMLSALEYKINPIDHAWSADPNRSSGVGKQISQRLFAKRMNMYQVKQSMVSHGNHASVMHPEHRKQVPLIAITDKITATVASMPSRVKSLEQTVNSILPQVDELWVYLNDYKTVPAFLVNPKILVFRSQTEAGDLGDTGKFYNCDKIQGYHLTIDDDLIYPPDYVKTMLHNIELNERKHIITIHGRVFGTLPVQSYYKNFKTAYSCLKRQKTDAFVNVGGTGVMAYHTDTLKVQLSDFKAINMADIWVGILANRQNIKILAIAHKANWVKEGNYNREMTICNFCYNNDKYQTEVVNKHSWSEL